MGHAATGRHRRDPLPRGHPSGRDDHGVPLFVQTPRARSHKIPCDEAEIYRKLISVRPRCLPPTRTFCEATRRTFGESGRRRRASQFGCLCGTLLAPVMSALDKGRKAILRSDLRKTLAACKTSTRAPTSRRSERPAPCDESRSAIGHSSGIDAPNLRRVTAVISFSNCPGKLPIGSS